jgi:hypothetical protein
MIRIALVRAAVVENVALVNVGDAELFAAYQAAGFEIVELKATEAVQPGDGWNGSAFTPGNREPVPLRGDIGDSFGDAVIESGDPIQTVVNDWKTQAP